MTDGTPSADGTLIAAIVLLISLGLYAVVRKGSSEDADEISWKGKLLLFPLLLILVLVPLFSITLVFAVFIKVVGMHNEIFVFDGDISLFTTALYVFMAMLLYDMIVSKVVNGLIFFVTKQRPSWALKSVLSIVAGTLTFYLFGSTIPGAHIQSPGAALSLSAFCEIAGWLLQGVHYLYKKVRARSNPGSGTEMH
jgi:hypothetical protein